MSINLTEAVEAAARAMYELLADYVGSSMPWERQNVDAKERFTEDARAALEAALPHLRAQFAEEVTTAWDNDKSLYALIEDRMLASEGRDADAVQDIGTEWLRNYTGGTK